MNQESYTDMKFQKPAEGISLQKDFGNSKFYQVHCDCGDPHHMLSMEVEADDYGIYVRHYVKVKTSWWDKPTKFYFLNVILNRLKLTWKVWTRGYIDYEVDTIMSKQQAFNYAYTLNEAIKDVEQFRKETSKKS